MISFFIIYLSTYTAHYVYVLTSIVKVRSMPTISNGSIGGQYYLYRKELNKREKYILINKLIDCIVIQ